MSEPTIGLRELKKQRTRQSISSTAARLFAEHGYDEVSVTDIARAAEVSPQTVYNYFPSKEKLVTDLDEFVRQRLAELIRKRPPGTGPAQAIRPLVLEITASGAEIPAEEWPGEIGNLALTSPSVRRLSLEMLDRQAAVIAAAILETSDTDRATAHLQSIAIAGVFQVMLDESALRTREGQRQPQIAREMVPLMERMLDELERWFAASTEPRRASPVDR